MLPASNRGAGMNIGFPDVCLTPAAPAPIPVPYPNIGMNAQAQAFSLTVKISGVNALNQGSIISMTSGDEAGSAHPMIKGMGKYTMGNPLVNIDKLPAINLGLPTTGNMMNNGLGLVAVPSAVNVLFCYAAEGGADVDGAEGRENVVDDATTRQGIVEVEELLELATAMRHPEINVDVLPRGVVVIRPRCFAAGMRQEVGRALRAHSGVTAILFDLRGCRGGDLHEAAYLAAEFLESGEVTIDLDEGGDRVDMRAPATAWWTAKLFILIDRATASAAEIFALALQSAGRATLVGERTFGKGCVQRLVPGAEGNLRVDVASWSVAGRPGQTGVHPDVELARVANDPDLWLKTAWALALRN